VVKVGKCRRNGKRGPRPAAGRRGSFNLFWETESGLTKARLVWLPCLVGLDVLGQRRAILEMGDAGVR
jgi:hypothetical protein